jgi:hypothetical protein
LGASPSTINFENQKYRPMPGSLYSEADFTGNLFYAHVGGRIRILPSLAIYGGFTKLGVEKQKRIDYTTTGIVRDSIHTELYGKSYYYSFPAIKRDTAIDFRIRQDDYYLNATFLPTDKWKVAPSIHFFQVGMKKINVSYQSVTKTDTAWYQTFDNSWHLFDYQSGSYEFSRADTSFSNYVISLNINRILGNLDMGLSGSISDFYGHRQTQAGVALSWYPFGNASLFSTTSAISVFNEGKQRMVYEETLGGKISKNLWLSGLVTIGNLELYNEKNGYVVYNQTDPIRFRTGVDAFLKIGSHIELYVSYRFCSKEFQSVDYVMGVTEENVPLLISVTSNYTYPNQSLSGGIKWKF